MRVLEPPKSAALCRLDVRVLPPWMAAMPKMQEQFIGLAPDVPEPTHPTSNADIVRDSCFCPSIYECYVVILVLKNGEKGAQDAL